MLRELRVADFAIIDEALVEFDTGFNVLTGETGAGKSILIEALGLALGGRSSDEMIRTGAEQAVVEALFETSAAPGLEKWLEDQGFPNSGELLIRRIVSRSGRNKAFINGSLATVAQARAAGEMLVDMHGQHEHQALFDPASHLPFLDSFLGLDAERAAYREKFDEYHVAKEKLRKLKEGQKELERRVDLLKFQVEEIESAALAPGEEETLKSEKSKLANVEKLTELASEAVFALDEGEGAASASLARAKAALDKMSEMDESVSEAAQALYGAMTQMDDAVLNLRGYAETLERDPDRLTHVDDRLDQIKNLKRKYGDTVEEIIAYHEKAKEELQSIEFDKSHIGDLEEKAAALGEEAGRLALALDKKRNEGSARFSRAVEKQLAELNMGKARIEPSFTYEEDVESPLERDGKKLRIGPGGAGSMEILFSSNPGEPPKPLVKIASGGEISRLMLALKTVLSGAQPIPVMIFDEIDAGIGGVTADRLGEKMRALAKSCQVFCITHLPQVARQGHTHFSVEKKAKKGRTTVTVNKLDRGGRIAELARMAGGGKATQTALKWAEEALGQG